MTQDELKQAAAHAAIAYVPDGIIGVGTGTMVNFFIDALADVKRKLEGAVASSEATARRLKYLGIPVLDLNEVEELEVYVDGTNEITKQMSMVKGGGGALTREKIIAANGLFAMRPADLLLLATQDGVKIIENKHLS